MLKENGGRFCSRFSNVNCCAIKVRCHLQWSCCGNKGESICMFSSICQHSWAWVAFCPLFTYFTTFRCLDPPVFFCLSSGTCYSITNWFLISNSGLWYITYFHESWIPYYLLTVSHFPPIQLPTACKSCTCGHSFRKPVPVSPTGKVMHSQLSLCLPSHFV